MEKLHIEGEIVYLRVNSIDLEFPLEWIIFGSKTSTDCDIIIRVPIEFVNLNLKTHVFNDMCMVFDKILGEIIGTNKEINSSLGYWDEKELLWAQKGSNTSEVNNSLISTFNNHKQMYDVCPIKIIQKRDVWDKICTTVRDILCKMNKTKFINDDTELTISFVEKILEIPEVRNLGNSFIHSFLRGYSVSKELSEEIGENIGIDMGDIIGSSENKRSNLKTLNSVLLDISKVRTVIEKNKRDEEKIRTVCENLRGDLEKLEKLRGDLEKETETDLIRLNRLVRQLRRRQELGVRLDVLYILDWTKVQYFMNEKDRSDRYKDIAFKLCQCRALLDGIELFDKEELCKTYPNMSPFLRRENITEHDLQFLTLTIREFIDRVREYDGYDRNIREIMRHNL